jgi:hypothetical protein
MDRLEALRQRLWVDFPKMLAARARASAALYAKLEALREPLRIEIAAWRVERTRDRLADVYAAQMNAARTPEELRAVIKSMPAHIRPEEFDL